MTGYITIAELGDMGLNPAAFVEVLAPRKRQAIAARSTYIDGFLRSRYTLPLLSWGDDIKRCCAILTSIDLIRNLGVGPDDATDLKDEEDRQDKWLAMVRDGKNTPSVEDSSPGATIGAPSFKPRVVSGSSRGFSVRGTGRSRGPFQGD